VTANVPPWAQEESDQVIESIKDSCQVEECILQPEDDEGNDEMEEDSPEEGQGQHDPEGKIPSSYLLLKLRLKRWVEEMRTYMLSARREQRSTFVNSWGGRRRFVNEIKL
jgi:hypothetical protein